MANIIRMPKLSDTMEDGGIAEWLKNEGEMVEEGEALLMIETDKATMEYPSPESGILLKNLQAVGASVDLNIPIAVLGEAGEKFDMTQLEQEASVANTTPEKASTEGASSASQVSASNSAQEAVSQEKTLDGLRVIASPLAKKIAQAKGLELQNIKGSGPRGRIIAQDLDQLAHQAPQPARSSIQSSGFDDIPVNRMRKTIAQRLLHAKNDAPHFYLTTTINMSECQAWRQELNSDDSLPRISINDLVMMATAKALKKHPQVNASWQGDFIRQHHDVHLAMAVALPDGLVTPVLQYAHQMSIRDIAKSSKMYGKKAKEGSLTPDEYQGGTFTISNLGMTCVDQFTAIINPPQACILAVGRIQDTPAFDSAGDLCCLPQMKITLSCDHRVVDGMVGAQFLKTLSTHLEKPLSMLEI